MPGLLNNEILERTRTLVHMLRVTLEEMYNGGTRTMAIMRNRKCNECDGRGSQNIIPELAVCDRCNGVNPVCGLCWGEGLAIITEHRCVVCAGRKVVPNNQILVVIINPGMTHGQKIIYKREGTQEPNKRVGDVVIILEQEPHQTFGRRGNDLLVTLPLTANEASSGFEKLVTTLDNRQLSLRAPGGLATPGNTLRYLTGEGMPLYADPTQKGKLIIRLLVNAPMVEEIMAQMLLND